jgi:hypothetical protein
VLFVLKLYVRRTTYILFTLEYSRLSKAPLFFIAGILGGGAFWQSHQHQLFQRFNVVPKR